MVMVRYLYQITNKVNGKIYIGVHQTRVKHDRYMGSGTVLKEAFKKYGRKNFEKTILEFFGTTQAMYDREAEIVDEEFIKCDDTYNIKVGGKGGFKADHNNGHAHHIMRSHRGGLTRKKQMEENGNPLTEFNRKRLEQ